MSDSKLVKDNFNPRSREGSDVIVIFQSVSTS